MRNRDAIIRKIEALEGNFSQFEMGLNKGGSKEDFITVLNKSKDNLADLKSMIEVQPIEGAEANHFIQK